MGSNVSNLRFLMPVLVIVGVALYNKSRGDANPVPSTDNPFESVTTEQFAAAILGFLTYRIPLFFSQIQDAFKDEAGNMVLPGSAGMAMQLAKTNDDEDSSSRSSSSSTGGMVGGVLDSLTPVLLVSGPQATGRSTLVQRLIEEGNGRFVTPLKIDRLQDGVSFERLEQRGEFLHVDPSGRYGFTKEGVVMATKKRGGESVVAIDADVALAKKLAKVPGVRLIGVWVGLNTVGEFEARLEAMIANGEIDIPEDETKESVIRARIKEIIKEIEYGISSGLFEFTILNEDEEKSLQELKEAAAYCFK